MQLSEARNLVIEQRNDGITCPCCDQYVKMYKRTLNGPMARILILIYRFHLEHPQQWLHVDNHLKQFGINCRYYSLLQFWNLIEPMPGEREDGSKRTGFWRITENGIAFAENRATVAKAMYMYNQAEHGFTEEQITIEEALCAGGFNYQEILNV